jgi:exopolysaccharide/PEP-CTERM locus tyrosine autokinase
MERAARHVTPAPGDAGPLRLARAQPRADVALDLEALAARGLLTDGRLRSLRSQEFRALKLQTLSWLGSLADGAARAPMVMVASALPGEGKSYCAVNLALSLAWDVDRSVLLVDADVVHPHVLPMLGIDGERRGLIDLLQQPGLSAEEVILRTNLPSLSVLPAGSASPRSSELLASAAMDRLLAGLAANDPRRIVVFDSSPLLPTVEARVLAAKVGLVLMVVEAGRTSMAEASEAFAMLQDLRHVVAVLNKCPQPRMDPLSYYGQGRS